MTRQKLRTLRANQRSGPILEEHLRYRGRKKCVDGEVVVFDRSSDTRANDDSPSASGALGETLFEFIFHPRRQGFIQRAHVSTSFLKNETTFVIGHLLWMLASNSMAHE